MSLQTSQDYSVDSRYHGGKGAQDNVAGKQFLKRFIQQRRQQAEPGITEQREEDNRFIMSGPGDVTYGFKNAFKAPLFNR
jgi:hypothetical protein